MIFESMDRFIGFTKGLTGSLGRNFILLDEVDSTNSYIMANDFEPGTVVAAACQTAGRGRSGRTWHSPEGCLTFSVVLPPADKTILNGIQILAAYATAYALLDYADISVKWPNDLLCGRKKIGGILLETVFSGNSPSKVALGIGLNVLGAPDIKCATCLSAHFQELPSIGTLMANIVNSLDDRYDEYRCTGDIQKDWPLYSAFYGKKISFHHRGREISGTERGITREGYIKVETNGVLEVYSDFSV
jgi:BirA family biotin operon repressor/biotin-[acetyl-CoA-carboxylase] ligase